MLFRTTPESPAPAPVLVANPALGPVQDTMTGLKVRIHQRLLDILNLSLLEKTPRESLRIVCKTWNDDADTRNRRERRFEILRMVEAALNVAARC